MAQLAHSQTTVRRTPLSIMMAGVLLATGTGGFLQAPPDSIGYNLPGVRFITSRHAAREQIKRILSSMAISNAGLARTLGVSRQALYNWLNGDAPSREHQAKLDSLTLAQETLAPLGQSMRALLTQPLQSGRNFWRLLQEGANADALAQQIKANFERRADQRALMAQRVASKRKKGTFVGLSSDDVI